MRPPRPPLSTAICRWTQGILIGLTAALPALADDPPLPEASLDFSESMLGDELIESAPLQGLEIAEPIASGEVAAAAPGSRRWRVAPHLETSVTYDDNVFIQPRGEVSDFIFTFEPGISIGIWDRDEVPEQSYQRDSVPNAAERERGSFLRFDYTAILLGFARETDQNAFDQDALLEGRWERGQLTLGGRVSFTASSAANIDVGTRVQTDTVAATITARYQLTGRTAVDAALSYTRRDPENFVQSTEWRAETFLDYALSPVVRSGLGLAAGQVEVEGGANQVFEQILGRTVYSPGEKVSLELRMGVDFRQSDGEAGDRTDPIFQVLGSWEPVAETRLGVEAFRRVENSALEPELDLLRTRVAVSAWRAVRGGWQVALSGGYETADYTRSVEDEDREDRYFFVRPGARYHFAAWGDAEASYEFRRNRSTRPDSEFENNLITLRVRLTY